MLREIEGHFGIVPHGQLFGRNDEIWLFPQRFDQVQGKLRFDRGACRDKGKIHSPPFYLHDLYRNPKRTKIFIAELRKPVAMKRFWRLDDPPGRLEA